LNFDMENVEKAARSLLRGMSFVTGRAFPPCAPLVDGAAD
jgi:hypothetical protein